MINMSNHLKDEFYFVLWNNRIHFNTDFIKSTSLKKFNNKQDISTDMNEIILNVKKNIIIINRSRHNSDKEIERNVITSYIEPYLLLTLKRIAYHCSNEEDIFDIEGYYYKEGITYFISLIRMLLLCELTEYLYVSFGISGAIKVFNTGNNNILDVIKLLFEKFNKSYYIQNCEEGEKCEIFMVMNKFNIQIHVLEFIRNIEIKIEDLEIMMNFTLISKLRTYKELDYFTSSHNNPQKGRLTVLRFL